jgi:hypothetical protein
MKAAPAAGRARTCSGKIDMRWRGRLSEEMAGIQLKKSERRRVADVT